MERLGLSQYVVVDPLLINDRHHFLLIHQRFQIVGHDAIFVLRYKGINVTQHVSRSFTDSVVGDAPADISSMDIQVQDKARKVPLSWRPIKDEPYQKLIEIYFLQPLKPGDKFDV